MRQLVRHAGGGRLGMTELTAFGFTRTFHIVADDHGQRAALAMQVSRCGGHAEIYEGLDEFLDTRPSGGALLIEFEPQGVEGLAESLQAEGVFLPIIVFSDNPAPSDVIRAAHQGVADFVDRDFSAETLNAAYDYSQRYAAMNGASVVRRQKAQAQIAALSARERQVLTFLLDGHSNKSMGKALDLSPRTIEDYRLNALRKLGVSSTSAAIRIGIEAGLKRTSQSMALAD